MSPIVLDCSVTMSWCFEDEAGDASELVLDRVVEEGGVVPQLWVHEVANVLVVAQRRRRVTESQAARFTSLLSQLPIAVAPECPSLTSLVALARGHGLTSYDATYLWLAESRGLPLATTDERLREACRTAGVATLPR
ncbi:MAG: type II toxin-antitoxin system VapC family toxin [Dermatophilaceae bacterium]